MLKKYNSKYYIKFIVLICIVVIFNILVLPRISHATDNRITSLKVEDRTYLNPNKDITLNPVDASTESITIKPITSEGAFYTINGSTNNTVPLKTGINIIKITVNGGDTYIVRITRLTENTNVQSSIIDSDREKVQRLQENNEDELLLTSLNVENFEITPEFSSEIYLYTIDIDMQKNDVDKLEIDAIPSASDAIVEIIGNEELVEGENIITILVKSADGTESVVYQIIVNKNDASSETVSASVLDNIGFLSNLNPFQRKLLIGFACFVLIVVIIVIIILIKKARKKREAQISFEGINNNDDDEMQNDQEETIDEIKEQEEIISSVEELNSRETKKDFTEKALEDDEPINKTTLDDEKAALMDEFFSYNQSIEEDLKDDKIEEKKKRKNRGKGKHF